MAGKCRIISEYFQMVGMMNAADMFCVLWGVRNQR